MITLHVHCTTLVYTTKVFRTDMYVAQERQRVSQQAVKPRAHVRPLEASYAIWPLFSVQLSFASPTPLTKPELARMSGRSTTKFGSLQCLDILDSSYPEIAEN